EPPEQPASSHTTPTTTALAPRRTGAGSRVPGSLRRQCLPTSSPNPAWRSTWPSPPGPGSWPCPAAPAPPPPGGPPPPPPPAAAASGASLYAVVQPGDLNWHVPAHRVAPVEAPALAAFLDHVELVVSLHGYLRPGLRTALLVGGANREQAEELGARLRAALPDYEVIVDLDRIPPDLRGVHPSNPVNLTRGGGVQLELPHPA